MSAQPSLAIFAVFLGITLVATYAATGQSTTSRGFYTAHRRIGSAQNGWAVAGDYLSAASFLGIALALSLAAGSRQPAAPVPALPETQKHPGL